MDSQGRYPPPWLGLNHKVYGALQNFSELALEAVQQGTRPEAGRAIGWMRRILRDAKDDIWDQSTSLADQHFFDEMRDAVKAAVGVAPNTYYSQKVAPEVLGMIDQANEIWRSTEPSAMP